MGKHKFLSLEERIQIEVGLKLKLTHEQLARDLDRSQSSVTREINRNTEGKELYLAVRSHARAMKRLSNQRRKSPLKDMKVWEYVLEKLERKWSPEKIAGRMSKDIPAKSIHHETIYRYIYKEVSQQAQLYQYLKCHRKKRMRKFGRKVQKAKIVGRIGIEKRPEAVTERLEFGHWETDNMEGKKTDTKVISVSVERKSRFIVASLTTGKSDSKTKCIKAKLKKSWLKTMTTDNGSENAGHANWGVKTYFCQPYHSWEKGTVENAIGQLRKWIPKGVSIKGLSRRKLSWMVKEYNQMPKKCLDWRTPEEVFLEHSSHLHATQLRI